MSKIVKTVTQPGLGDPLGIHKGGGKKKGPENLTGGGRRDFVSEATSRGARHFMPEKESWQDYVKSTQKSLNKPAPRPEPAPAFEFPSFSFNYPDYPSAPRAPKAQTTAERLQNEAKDVAKAEGREAVASRAQGLSTRLRAAVAPKRAVAGEEEDDVGSSGDNTLGLPTLLGSRSRGGQTSYRRKRISRY